jgi:uncharacterized protein (DUF849 family)
MVAPNGARRNKSDHTELPLTIPEITETAKLCWEAGAGGLHLHVRNKQGKHTLDSGLYSEAIYELKKYVPEMLIQITTEAVGQYLPKEQINVVKKTKPKAASVSIKELLSKGETKEALDFYHWCYDQNIDIQHILYDTSDLDLLEKLLNQSNLTLNKCQLLFVLGRYSKNQQSQPDDLIPFIDWLKSRNIDADWAACAFGKNETKCLHHAYMAGGKVRIGFENSLINANGRMALNNAERVIEIKQLIES